MTIGDMMVGAVALFQIGACISYACEGRWPQSFIWLGAAMISTGTVYLGRIK